MNPFRTGLTSLWTGTQPITPSSASIAESSEGTGIARRLLAPASPKGVTLAIHRVSPRRIMSARRRCRADGMILPTGFDAGEGFGGEQVVAQESQWDTYF